MDNDFRRALFLAAALAVVSSLAPFARGQQLATAGIYGAVVDAQGAVVPAAHVTLTDIARNQQRETVTNGEGLYTFPSIPVGDYRIRIEHPGFSSVEQTAIHLEVNDNRKLDVVLQVGEISTKVQVEAAAVAVETSSATLKSVVDSKRIVELPLNGRNVASLTALTPGVIITGSSNGGSKDSAGSIGFSINGSRSNTLKFTLDGGDNEDNLQNENMPFPSRMRWKSSPCRRATRRRRPARARRARSTSSRRAAPIRFTATGFGSCATPTLTRELPAAPVGQPEAQPGRRHHRRPGDQEQAVLLRRLSADLDPHQPHREQDADHAGGLRTGDFSALLKQAKPVVITDPATNAPFAGNIIPQVAALAGVRPNLLKFSPVPAADGYDHWRVSTPGDYREYISRLDYRLPTSHSFTARYYQNDSREQPHHRPEGHQYGVQFESTYPRTARWATHSWPARRCFADTRVTVARTFGIRRTRSR